MGNLLLVDTDVLIDVGRNLPEAISFLEKSEAESELTISAITKMELLVGCRNKTELNKLEKFLERFKLVTLDKTITDAATDLLRRYRLSHGLLIPDALIAATAISINAQFVTKNQKDFRFITSLHLNPYP